MAKGTKQQKCSKEVAKAYRDGGDDSSYTLAPNKKSEGVNDHEADDNTRQIRST